MTTKVETAVVERVFVEFPKLARLNRACVITEKIDGTNAAVVVTEEGEVYAQSRTRVITPDDDNFGFALWVERNAPALAEHLGPGRHFGEWWGGKIQRGYGVADKRFSLFNTARWSGIEEASGGLLRCVPVLYEGPFDTAVVAAQVTHLRAVGSVAAPGFANPEGVVVFHVAANLAFKVTCEKDEQPKSKGVK